MNKQIIGSPLRVDILMHVYCCNEPIRNKDAPAVEEAIQSFIDSGVFRHSDNESGYECTDKGRAWVERIVKTPIPKKVFLDENDNVIDV